MTILTNAVRMLNDCRIFMPVCLMTINVAFVTAPRVIAEVEIEGGQPTCEFPPEVRGHWLDNRGHRYTIKESRIDQMGPCIHQKDNQYVLHVRSHDCNICFRLNQRHFNSLQFETECNDPELSDYEHERAVCNRWEYHLPNLMLREQHIPVTCPFKGAYDVAYANHSNEFCINSTSLATPCAAKGGYYFRFRRCPNMPTTFNTGLHVSCVGHWENRNWNYLLVRKAPGDEALRVHQKYFSCMRYYKKGSIIYLEKYSESYCKGPSSMVIKMIPSVGDHNMLCALPSWLGTHRWRDLSGQLAISGEKLSRYLYMELGRPSTTQAIRMSRLTCRQILSENSARLVAVMRATHGCLVGYQCIEIKRWLRDVIEVHLGTLHEDKITECPAREFSRNNNSSYLIIPDSLVGTPCPLAKGHYKMLSHQSENCSLSVQSQCSGTSHLDVYYRCRHSTTVVNFSCLKHWTVGSRTRIIVRRTDDSLGTSNCLMIRKRRDSVVMAVDKSCNIGVPFLLKGIRRFRLNVTPGVCREIQPVHETLQDDRREAKVLCEKGCGPSVETIVTDSASKDSDSSAIRPRTPAATILLILLILHISINTMLTCPT